MNAPLFDTHCHLDYDTFGEDFDAVLARAKAAGVVKVCTIGCGRDLASAESALLMARKLDGFAVATVGVHPHDASALTDELLAAMETLAADPLIVAIGEVGLDYHYDHSPREVQREVFRKFIALAKRVKKPLTIHTRTAAAETLEILREENARDVGGIIHCFSEDAAFAKAALDMGFVASFSGIVTFKSAEAIRDAAKRQPADAILIETDSPYLAPIPHRGKRNEPSYVAKTAAILAELRGVDYESFAHTTTESALRVYRMA